MSTTPSTYVTGHPSREDYLKGYAAGMATSEEDFLGIKVVLFEDCPPDKIYITSAPIEKGIL